MLSDTRTNAGFDNIACIARCSSSRRRRAVIVLRPAGNLASPRPPSPSSPRDRPGDRRRNSIMLAETMLESPRSSARTLTRSGSSLPDGWRGATAAASASMLLGGQRRGGAMRLFLIYPEGNFIEATEDTPSCRSASTSTAGRSSTGWYAGDSLDGGRKVATAGIRPPVGRTAAGDGACARRHLGDGRAERACWRGDRTSPRRSRPGVGAAGDCRPAVAGARGELSPRAGLMRRVSYRTQRIRLSDGRRPGAKAVTLRGIAVCSNMTLRAARRAQPAAGAELRVSRVRDRCPRERAERVTAGRHRRSRPAAPSRSSRPGSARR